VKIFLKGALLSIVSFTFLTVSASAQQAVEKEWTIAVFLNGDNNLDSAGSKDMREMEMVGSDANVNIVVLRDTSKTNVSSKIFYVEKGKSTTVKDYGSNIDMGDWNNLVDFFKFVKTNYPAKRFLVDIWNHGSGWRRSTAQPVTKGISYDDHSGNHISTPQLGQAFAQMMALNDGKRIDILGMDACLMQMAEVAYEVSDSVNVVVGSEQTEPADGWAYETFLPHLVAKPTMDAEELGTVLEREYTASYNGGSQGTQTVQGSVVSAPKVAAAVQKLNDFISYAITVMPGVVGAIKTASNEAQKFYYSEYKDAIHFVQLIQAKVGDTHLKDLAEQLLVDLDAAVIANFTTGTSLSNSKGIAIWVPTSTTYNGKKAAYSELKWAKQTQWDEFLESVLFPNTPVVTIAGLEMTEETVDGFNVPGEKIAFKLTLKNEAIAAKNAKVYLMPNEAFETFNDFVAVGEIPNGTINVVGLWAKLASGVAPGQKTIAFKVEMPGYGSVTKEFPFVMDPEYTFENYSISSPHDYPVNFDQTWTITKSGVAGMRVHFAKFQTEAYYDYVQILDKNDNVIATRIDGQKDPFWTPYVAGDTVKIRLVSDYTVNAYGFDIDKIAY